MTSIGKGDAGSSDPRMLNQQQREMLGGRGGAMAGRDEHGPVGADGRPVADPRAQQAAMVSRAAAFMRSVQHALHDDTQGQDAPANQQAAAMVVLASSLGSSASTIENPAAAAAGLPTGLQDIVAQIQVIIEKQAIRPIGSISADRFDMQLKLMSSAGADLHGIRVSLADGELDVILMHAGEVPSVALSEAARSLVDVLRLRYPQRVVRVLGRREDGAQAEVVQDGLSAISQLLAASRNAT